RRCVLQRRLQGAAQRRRQPEHRHPKGATRGGRRAPRVRTGSHGKESRSVAAAARRPGRPVGDGDDGQSAVARVRPSGVTGYRIVRAVYLWVANGCEVFTEVGGPCLAPRRLEMRVERREMLDLPADGLSLCASAETWSQIVI